MTHYADQERVIMEIERVLIVRSLDEWVMQTGAVGLNSSWHSELQALIEMAFDKGAEVHQCLFEGSKQMTDYKP